MKRGKKKYAKLNHLLIKVRDSARSRDWYVKNLGLHVEFEVKDVNFVALEDDWGMALLIAQEKVAKGASFGFVLHFEVEDVNSRYRELRRRRVKFVHPPKNTPWGYGPELLDPDGYVVRLFDHRSISK